ncbi:hypothetical protein IPdc08_01753 [archaeon]|nr:hypothetical protein IPdc08_01753 [archaeon]
MKKTLLLILALILIIPGVHAICSAPPISKFPGFQVRFTGYVHEGVRTPVDEFSIKPTFVFPGGATFEVYKYGEDYERFTVMAGGYYRGMDNDIIIELEGTSGTESNITVYTGNRARLKANISINPEVNYNKILNSSLPAVRAGRELYLTITLNNTGALPAENISVEPLLKDFKVLTHPENFTAFLCPGNKASFSYILLAPLLWKITNYSLPVKVKYSYSNEQTGNSRVKEDVFKGNLTVVGESYVSITKMVRYPYNFKKMRTESYALVGQKVYVTVEINNTGRFFDFLGKVDDILPQGLKLVQGKTFWEGRLPPGYTVYLNYVLTASAPADYHTYSLVEYKGEYGNVVAKNKSEIRIIKFVELKPQIEVIENIHTNNGFNTSKIVMNPNETANVSVVIKNTGSAVAYGVNAGVKTNLETEGNSGIKLDSLAPGKEVSYTYILKANRQGKYEVTTEVTYRDEFSNLYSSTSSKYIYVDSPAISLNMESRINNGKLFFEIEAKNVGTRAARNLIITVDYPKNFRLISGQSVNSYSILGAGKTTGKYDITFLIPGVKSTKTFDFLVETSYNDQFYHNYKEELVKSIELRPLSQNAILGISGKNLYKLDEKGLIEVYIKNTGAKAENFILNVAVPENIEYLPMYGKKDREVFLKPGESFSYKFSVKAVTGGDGSITAHADYGGITAESELRFRVEGPVIEVYSVTPKEKIVVRKEFTLKYIIKNIGYGPALNMKAITSLPKNIEPIGAESKIGRLDVQKEKEIAIHLRANKNGKYISKLVVSWSDEGGKNYLSTTESKIDVPVIVIKESSKARSVSKKINARVEEKAKILLIKKIAIILTSFLLFAAVVIFIIRAGKRDKYDF